MNADRRLRLAILYPGDRVARDRSVASESRFAALFEAFAAASRMSRRICRLLSCSASKRPQRDWSGGIGFAVSQAPQAYW